MNRCAQAIFLFLAHRTGPVRTRKSLKIFRDWRCRQGCKSGHFFPMRFESKIGNFKLENRCVSNRPLVKIKNALRIDAYFFFFKIRNRIDALKIAFLMSINNTLILSYYLSFIGWNRHFPTRYNSNEGNDLEHVAYIFVGSLVEILL